MQESVNLAVKSFAVNETQVHIITKGLSKKCSLGLRFLICQGQMGAGGLHLPSKVMSNLMKSHMSSEGLRGEVEERHTL